jgi:hypothetical protein
MIISLSLAEETKEEAPTLPLSRFMKSLFYFDRKFLGSGL